MSWNHNTHYHRALLRRLPAQLDTAVDIGCGDGTFALLLATRARRVVAIDDDADEVATARARSTGASNVTVECADVMTWDAGEQFDAVTSLAVLHHLPFEEALSRMADLVAPKGTLVVLGVWPDRLSPLELALSLVAVVCNLAVRAVRGHDRMTSPAAAPTMSMNDVRRRAREVLPGVRVQRRVLWRYVLTWTAPD